MLIQLLAVCSPPASIQAPSGSKGPVNKQCISNVNKQALLYLSIYQLVQQELQQKEAVCKAHGRSKHNR